MSIEEKYIDHIAVIGMAGRFPGSNSIDEFWDHIRNGIEGIRDLTDDDLLQAGVDEKTIQDKDYVRRNASIPGSDLFDASFFGFSPREAELTDPQHRLFLECAWEALEHSGYVPEKISGSVGVFGGCGMSHYFFKNILANQKTNLNSNDLQKFLASEKDFLATRVSYKLNLTGPSLTIQTACSTSLVAIQLACQHLLNYQCDMALAGGVSLQLPRNQGYIYKQGDVRSPQGKVKAFDDEADGTIFGDGVGIVVLKRADEALRDGDFIWALIKSAAINNDGSEKIGFTAPSINGQVNVIKFAHALAGIQPTDISYIESHGTGTPLGDPIEIAALKQAFGDIKSNEPWCGIGSVKTNIGHLDTAAGVASFIKLVNALHYKEIPPSLHFNKINKQIDLANTPFYINSTLKSWESHSKPRIAGISSFGFGGTNVHVILEEAPELELVTSEKPFNLLMISAQSEAALKASVKKIEDYIIKQCSYSIADIAYTLQVGRRDFNHRYIAVCENRDTEKSKLLSQAKELQLISSGIKLETPLETTFMFTGQGSQFCGMGKDLYFGKNGFAESVFHESVSKCADLFQKYLSIDIRDMMFNDSEENRNNLDKTMYTQPTLFTIEWSMAQTWIALGVQPSSLIGHSIGEYVAATIAGVFSLNDAIMIVANRAKLLQIQAPGKMIYIPQPPNSVREHLNNKLEISVVNTPDSCVISGDFEAIEKLEIVLKEKQIDTSSIRTSHAFHSYMMEPALESFTKLFTTITLKPPTIPFISNVTGDWINTSDAISPKYWADHLRKTVLFAKGIETIINKNKNHVFIEMGPGNTLCSFVQSTVSKVAPDKVKSTILVPSLRNSKTNVSDQAFFLKSVGIAWITGLSVNREQLFSDEKRMRVPLPTYPLERKSFWIEPDKSNLSISENVDVDSIDLPISQEKSSIVISATQTEMSIEETIRTIWQDVLGVKEIADQDDFFKIGGDSIWASQVISRVRDHFKIELPNRSLFDNSTLEAFTKLIRPLIENSSNLPIILADELKHRDEQTVSLAQQRLWFLSLLEPDSIAFNLALGLHIEGDLNQSNFEKAYSLILKRQDALRTKFDELEDGNVGISISQFEKLPLEIIDLSNFDKEIIEQSISAKIFQITKRPYKLNQIPLCYGLLFKIDKKRWRFIFTVHHSIFDGWSWGIFIKELGETYDLLSKNADVVQPELLPITYSDYAFWQRQRSDNVNLEKSLTFWKKELAAPLPILELPSDRPRSANFSYEGALEKIRFSDELTTKIKKICKDEDVTIYMFLLTCFQALLYRYTNNTDIIVGCPVANRNRVEFEKIIGFFINMIPIRTPFNPTESFIDLLRRNKNLVLSSFEHQDIPFEKLVEIAQPSRDLSYNPIYQVMFAYQNFPLEKIHLPQVTMESIPVDRGASQIDIWLQMWEDHTSNLVGVLEYSTELFNRDSMQRFINHYTTLIENVIADKVQKVESIPITPNEEFKICIESWNQTTTDDSFIFGIHGLFDLQVKKTPQKIACETLEGSLTYAELNQKSNKIAQFLISCGVKENDLIGLYIDRSLEMITGLLGILKSGAAYVPLDPNYPEDRLSYMIEDSGMKVILTKSSLQGNINSSKVKVFSIDSDIQSQSDVENVVVPVNRNSSAYVIYTSGSTGRPKGVRLSHGGVTNFLKSMAKIPGMDDNDTILAVTTLSFDIAVLELILPLTVGAKTFIVNRDTSANGNELLKILNQVNPTIMQATPGTWRLLLNTGWNGSEMLKILCGGEAFPRDLLRELLPKVKAIWNMYGPTETTVWSTCKKLVDADDVITIGKPIDNTKVYVLDQNLLPCPIGIPGELFIGGTGVALEYVNRPDLTSERFMKDPFTDGGRMYRTGDLVKWLANGELEYLNRIDSQVKVRGFRIELGEIESVLKEDSSIEQAIAITRVAPGGDTRLIVYYKLKQNSSVTITDLRNILRKKLPDYMIPQHFVEIHQIPYTPAGKIDKKNLPSPFDNVSHKQEKILPRSYGEKLIAEIWSKVLGAEHIGIHDNFFEIGGHSLLSMQVINSIKKQTGIELSPRSILLHTLEQIASNLPEKEMVAPENEIKTVKKEKKKSLFNIFKKG